MSDEPDSRPMSLRCSFLGSKPVVDADRETIGRVAGAERDPDTDDTVSLLVQIDPVQTDDDGDDASFCWLPVDAVDGIRRDGIRLNERLATLLPRGDGRRGAHHSDRR
jgi:hypothetical protein